MSLRNSPNAITDLGDPSRLADFVFDKREGQRASAKKQRRNRHYEKQFIRNTLADLPQAGRAAADKQDIALPEERTPKHEEGSGTRLNAPP